MGGDGDEGVGGIVYYISQTSRDKETLEEVLKYERECDLWLKNKLKRDQ